MPSTMRRRGVLLPLFSAVSSRSWGIGDCGDLPAIGAWLTAAGLDDLMLLIWTGTERTQALDAAKRELDQLYRDLNEGDLRLEDHGRVMVCISVAEIDDDNDLTNRGERMRLRELLGQDLNATDEWLLVADNRYILDPSHTLDFSDEPTDTADTEGEDR